MGGSPEVLRFHKLGNCQTVRKEARPDALTFSLTFGFCSPQSPQNRGQGPARFLPVQSQVREDKPLR